MLVSAFSLTPRTQLEADVRLLPLGTFISVGVEVSLKTAQAEGEWSHISPATHRRHQAAAPLPAPLLHVAGWMVVAPEGVSHQNTQQWRAARCLSPAHHGSDPSTSRALLNSSVLARAPSQGSLFRRSWKLPDKTLQINSTLFLSLFLETFN